MKTIDVLILETLALGKVTTAQELSELWGEDRTRVHEWLEKFRKRGLCNLRQTPAKGRKLGVIAYLGNPNLIALHLKNRANGSAQ